MLFNVFLCFVVLFSARLMLFTAFHLFSMLLKLFSVFFSFCVGCVSFVCGLCVGLLVFVTEL